jgi:hypothetical protein
LSSSEKYIEDNVIRNREAVLGVRDSLFIRRCRIWPGHGIADLVILPQRGQEKIVVVEAKQASSADAKMKVMGQLLMYYTGVLNLGSAGLRLMRRYAVDNPRSVRSRTHVSGKALSGGLTPPTAAWAALGKGRKLRPSQVALWVALDASPSVTLKAALSVLANEHSLEIGVVSVLARDRLEVWRP